MDELFVEKYEPRRLEDVAGNSRAIKEIREFIRSFSGGKAILLHGPPGVGKSMIPRIAARELGFHFVEINASDERGKEAMESYLSPSRTRALFSKGRIILIDEIDGLSAGDRGGSQSIMKLVASSRFPVFLAANDPWIPKLKSLRKICILVKLNRIPAPSIEKFLREVCKKEGIEAGGNVLRNLARFSEGDLRAALTDLQVASCGKKVLEEKDLMAVGYREGEYSVFNVLPTIFRCGRVSTARKLIFESNRDAEEIFWWIENNLEKEFSGRGLVAAFELLSKADIFRALVAKQQNWAFRGYMTDLMAGVSVHSKGDFRYVAYRPPDRFIQMARARQRKAMVEDVCERLGRQLHCSRKVVRRDYLPYLKIILEKTGLGMDEEDAEVIKGM
jgi:replication factor C large subunit